MEPSPLSIPAGMRYLFLPGVPAQTSEGLRTATESYLAGFLGDDGSDTGSDAREIAAKAVWDFDAASITDVAVKLLYAIHYLEPSLINGAPAIDLAAFDVNGGRILARCAADALRLAATEGR